MKKFLLTITLILSMFMGSFVSTAGANGTVSQVNALSAIYSQIYAAFRSPTSTRAEIETLFVRYSSEAVAFAGDDHTRSKIINADIRAYAVAANSLAWIGYQTLASNESNMSPWKAANARLNTVLVKFNNDLKAGR